MVSRSDIKTVARLRQELYGRIRHVFANRKLINSRPSDRSSQCCCPHYSRTIRLFNVALPEWLTGSPAILHCQRLHIVRECSNRDNWLPSLWNAAEITALDRTSAICTEGHRRIIWYLTGSYIDSKVFLACSPCRSGLYLQPRSKLTLHPARPLPVQDTIFNNIHITGGRFPSLPLPELLFGAECLLQPAFHHDIVRPCLEDDAMEFLVFKAIL